MNLSQFERYVHQHQDRLYGFACYYLGDNEEAMDVTQEVLIRLWKHRDEVDEARLLGWVLRVARNACIDALRRRKAYRSVMECGSDGVDEAAGDEPLPDDEIQTADSRQRIDRALGRLADPYRTIVILREIQEMKYEEISEAMDMPLGTVKVYLHRGRKMLREQLGEVRRELV